MKKYIYILFFISFLTFPVLIFSQDTYWMTPVSAWKDSNKDWQSNGMSFLNFNGNTYIFSINSGKPHMYIKPLGAKSGVQDFKVGGSNVVDYPHSTFDDFYNPLISFNYNGTMWFYFLGEKDKTYYEVFTQIPTNVNSNCNVREVSYSSKPAYQKMYAFQLDSNVYFISKSFTTSDWYAEEYYWDNVNLSSRRSVKIDGIPESNFGGLVKKTDSLHNPYFIISTYTVDGNISLGKLIPQYAPDGVHFVYQDNISVWNPQNSGNFKWKASSLMNGSVRGGNTSTTTTPAQYCDRFTLFSTYLYPTSNGNSTGMHVDQFYISRDRIFFGYSGAFQFADGNTPSTSLFRLNTAYELVPSDFSTALPGIDGFSQRNFVYFPFGDKKFSGVYVDSDNWRVDSAKTCFNDDLFNTTRYDPSVKGLWTLIGIVDGAPPAPINWPVWGQNHPLATAPTSLTLKSTSSKKMSLSTTTDDQWSVAGDMGITAKIPEVGKVSVNSEIDFAQSIKQFTSNSTDTTITLTLPFDLYENNQDTGVFIYSVPTIWRYTYSVYPWYDKQLQYPVPMSRQYLYRTSGTQILPVAKGLNQSPFYVNDPNGATMNDWGNRPDMQQAISQYNMHPAISLIWSSPFSGPTGTIDVTNDSVTGCETKASFSDKLTMGYEEKIPLIFKIDASMTVGYDISYSTETRVKTSFSNGVEATYKNMQSVDDGILCNKINMQLYWFKPETNPNWWFYEGLGTDKPWYLAYKAGTGKSFGLLHPENKKELLSNDRTFAWEPGDPDLSDYTLFIATSPNIANNNIVYSGSAGKGSSFTASDFIPEKGMTYFWSVRGFDAENEPVWSPVWSFSVNADEIPGTSALMASVYPNPGTVQQMKYSIMSAEGKEVRITLFDGEGRTVASKAVKAEGEKVLEFTFNDVNLIPGVYVAVINNSKEQIIKKIIIR